MPIHVKICGITNLEDALLVSEVGADYVGCVVDFPRSPRSVSAEEAGVIYDAAGATPVAVVVNPGAEQLELIEATARCEVIQLSGDESVEWVAENRGLLDSEVWKTLHLPGQVGDDELAEAVARVEAYLDAGVDRILIDRAKGTGSQKQYGGTGECPDWEACARLIEATGASVVLAGGLNPDNVSAAIETVRPAVVDVSSGVEASPGKKDADGVRRFVEAARSTCV